METINYEVLKSYGRWLAIFLLLSSSGFSQEEFYTASGSHSIWHNALFIFCICFFVAGFLFLFMVKVREEKQRRQRHARRLSHRHHR